MKLWTKILSSLIAKRPVVANVTHAGIEIRGAGAIVENCRYEP